MCARFVVVSIFFFVVGSILPGRVEAAYRIEERREAFVSGGRRIALEIFAPATRDRYPAVLVLHSSAGTIVGKRELQRFSRALAAQGNVALLVHYFDRTGTIWASDDQIARLPPVWIETVQDAVDFASRHPRVRSDAIGIFGYSLGAYLAVAESSRDRRVKAVVEIAGGIFEGFRPRMERMPPMLILHGRKDRRVPVARAYELAKAGRELGASPTVVIYEREGHVFSRLAIADATRRTLAFFARHQLNRRVRTEKNAERGRD